MKRIFILIPVFIVMFLTAKGQNVSVSAAFDTSRIFIGDQIHYIITIDQPSGLTLSIKPLHDTLCKNIEIVSGPVLDSSVIANNRLRLTRKYLVTSFDSGFYQAPLVYAEIKDASGIKRFYSEYSPLEVMRVKIAPPDTTKKIFDIIKPYKAPLTPGEILPWVFIALLCAALVWGAIILLRRLRKTKTGVEPVKNPDPAHLIAFRKLERLKEEQLWQKGEVKLYYSRLTEILREYLENRYNVFSLEMTTSETLEALLKTGFKKGETFSSLKTILNGSDLVKFAKYKPDPGENEEHFENSWKFVDITKVKEQVPENPVTNEKKEDKS